jgi:hypothetical protein
MSRPARTEEVKSERRRRGSGPTLNMKLHVPEESKDPNFVYRWVNDKPGRVQQLTTQDDWDKAPIVTAQNAGEGTVETRVTDRTAGDRAVLLRKPREYFEADKAEQQAQLDATDEAMRRGAAQSHEGLSGSEAYVPGGAKGREGRNIVSSK